MNAKNYFFDAANLGKETGLDSTQPRRQLPAFSLLDTFEQQRPQGLWPHIHRERLARELRERVDNPNVIDQHTANLCGITTIVRTWAFDFPAEYVRFTLDLFTRGKAQMIGRSARIARMVNPSVDLRHAAPPQGMPHADWIVAASVRESLNSVFDYSPGEGIFAIKAWTLPSDVEREFKILGYTRIHNKANVAKSSGYESLMEASQLYQNGWRVILLISASLVDGPTTAGLVQFGDHWVGLDSAIVRQISSGRPHLFPFRLWTWTRSVTVPANRVPIPLDAVISRYFGFVAGRF